MPTARSTVTSDSRRITSMGGGGGGGGGESDSSYKYKDNKGIII